MESADNLPNIQRSWERKKAFRGAKTCSKIRLRRALRNLKEETREYFYDTSLHGFKYIVSSDSTFVEKVIWILICTLGTIFCIILMCLVWQRFQENPTVTTIETTSHPIWELPFPAVTICNFNKIYLPRYNRFVEELSMGLNETEIDEFFRSLPKLIRTEYINANVDQGMRALTALGYTIEDLMHLLMQPCDKLLVKCGWLGRTYDCSKMFRTIKSIEGFCCAFNYHAVLADFEIEDIKWLDDYADEPTTANNDEKMMPEIITPSITSANSFDDIPGRDEIQMVTGSGRDVGLSVIFDLEGELYAGATRPYVGASILFHDPQDYPEISLLTALAEPGKEIDVSITGTIIESVENIRGLNIGQRRCWFDDEKKLRLSSAYSYQTCITECKINQIRRLCNCVPFYYPNSFSDTRICELTDVKCMRDHRRILSSLRASMGTDVENRTIEVPECNCLPQCSDKWYSLASETADIKGIKYDGPMFQYYSYGLDIRNLTFIYVYFRDITCLKYRKDILLTWDGFFASFGGIFGLCLGGSMISLIELIYYYVVRIFHRNKGERITINDSTDKVRIDGRLVYNNKRIFNNNYHSRINKIYSFDEFRVANKLGLDYLE